MFRGDSPQRVGFEGTVPGKIVRDSDNVAENERKNYTAKDIEF